jgi:CubicO group peptidase (beta-lactamase class C family)
MKDYFKCLAVFFFLILGFNGVLAVSAELAKGDLGAKLDTYLTRITPFGFSGALLAVKDSEVILNKGYGMAVRSKGIPNTAQTVFCTGSITKQFTAAGIMKLEMMGKLRTEDSLGKYLNNVPEDKKKITLHHLLTHTSGLVQDVGGDYEIAARDETVKKILAQPLEFEPGTEFRYTNLGYTLLAAVIELVSVEPYEKFLNQHLFKPAGMDSTGYWGPGWSQMVVAHWYNGEIDNGIPLEKNYPYWNLIGNGGILSTTDDMFRWHRALLGEKILSAEAKKKLFTPFLNDYGYGWDILKTPRGTLIQHDGGSTLGNSAEIRRYIDAGIVTILFCNQSYGLTPLFEVVRDKIQTLVFGGEVPLPPPTISRPESEMAKYAGTYKLPTGGELDVTAGDSRLRISGKGKDAFLLLMSNDAGDEKALDALSQKTASIIQKSAEGVYEPLYEAFAGRLPLDRIKTMETEMWEMRKSRFGKFENVEILGTVPSLEGGATYARVHFERGEPLLIYSWGKNVLQGIQAVPGLPENTFRPVSSTAFLKFDIRTSAAARIEVGENRLTFVTSRGAVRAGKIV